MGFFQSVSDTEWLIADGSGNPVLPLYSYISHSIDAGGSAVSAPIEEGSFNSYNKTSEPKKITIEVSFSGTRAELHEALDKVDELKESTKTFSIITPYYEYENFTLESYSSDMRTETGWGVMFVTLQCVEIKETQAMYSSVSQDAIQSAQTSSISADDATNPSDVSTVETGQTATSAPTAAQESTAAPQRESILYKMENGW